MYRKILTIIIIVLLVATVGYLARYHVTPLTSSDSSSSPEVVTSFYPLYFFASQIAGGQAQIYNMTPAGAEPHDYEPTPQDLVKIQNSKLIVINDAGLELWAARLKPDIEKSGITIVSAATDVPLLATPAGEDETMPFDPHIWINPVTAKKEVANILEGFKKVDPANAAMYDERASILEAKLNALDTDFKTGLAHCQQTSFVTSHAAFGYLAAQYHLTQIPIAGLSPDAEPSAAQLAQIADFVKSNNIKYIFFESLVSPKLSDTMAREVGAQTLVLNPLEGLTGQEIVNGEDYFSVMRQNLQYLRIALQCQ